jgi:hypothetical protein
VSLGKANAESLSEHYFRESENIFINEKNWGLKNGVFLKTVDINMWTKKIKKKIYIKKKKKRVFNGGFKLYI